MALKIYTFDESLSFEEVSVGTFLSPVTLGVTPGGSAKVKKLYIRNGDNTKWYDGIQLRVKSTTGQAIVDGSVSIKLLSGDARPTEDRWDAASANDSALIQSPIAGGPVDERLPEIGSAAGADLRYYPFWIRVAVNRGAPIGDAHISLQLTDTEHVV